MVQRLDSPKQRASDSLLMEHPPQDTPSDTVKCLFPINKTHVTVDIELVQCFTVGRKKTHISY